MTLRVMIVEDEPLIGAAMQMYVEDIGGEVSGPHMTLAAGLAAARHPDPIDVALLDCNIGRDTSWPIAEALAERGVPFVFTSGKGPSEIDPRFADRPIFSKPVDESQLKTYLEGLKRA